MVSNPDAAHIGGFLDVLDAYEIQTVHLSGEPKGISTFNAFLRSVRDEDSLGGGGPRRVPDRLGRHTGGCVGLKTPSRLRSDSAPY